jgi:hydrogenase nickel incorporation protein HypA/HybF
MHELAIADAVVDIALAHARGRRVTRLEVTVGHLRQVVPAALRFGVEVVSRGTPVEGAELVLAVAPAAGRCRDCGATSVLEHFPFACPACGGFGVEVTSGEELRVESIDVDDQEPEEVRP